MDTYSPSQPIKDTFCFHLLRSADEQHPRQARLDPLLLKAKTIRLRIEVFWAIYESLLTIPTRYGSFAGVPWERPVIGIEGAPRARQVFNEWGDECRKLAGETIELSALQRLSSLKSGFSGKIKFSREGLIQLFTDAVDFADAVETGEYLIYWSDLMDYTLPSPPL